MRYGGRRDTRCGDTRRSGTERNTLLLSVVLAAAFAAGAPGAAAPSGAAESAGNSAGVASSEIPVSSDGLASTDGRYLEWMDSAVPPGRDFFRYANGGWIRTHPMPPDRSYWGVDTLLEQRNQTLIRDMLVSLSKDDSNSKGSVQRKVADFYDSGMDERGIDAAGIAPMQSEFDRIAALADLDELQAEFARLQLIGVTAPLQLSQMQDFKDSTRVIALALQGGLGLPNRDYYLQHQASFAAARSEYVLHMARMFVLLGDSPAAAERQSKAVMILETELARRSMPDAEQRDPRAIYHPMMLREAAALAPHLNWRGLLKSVGHPEIDSLNVAMPEFFRALDRELSGTSLADWKTYLRWQLINAYAPYLSKAFVDEDFHMRSVLTGAQELQARWLRVLTAEDEALGFAVGEMYVARNFSPAAKQASTSMVERIREALRTDLRTLAWMSPATRTAAIEKLGQMELRIGYPDRWRDYSALEIDRGPYVLNVLRAREFEQRRQYGKIGKPVDRTEWSMTPQTVNAYYDPSMNSLNVPAGILQPPFFDVGWPDAVNYGATGATTVGHEMTHGFDDQGAKFDGHGNLKNWWAPRDLKRFQAATRCIAEQFSLYTVPGGLHVQGDLVTGEAAADLGGLILAWRALHALPAAADTASARTPDLSTDKEFFIAFAHSWAGQMRPEQAQESVTTDPHPPAEFRTNGTLANDAEFQAAFGIPIPSPMVKSERCVIW
jgi:putative endopeptidase